MDKRLIDVEEVAEYLGLTISTVYSWISEREIPYVKMGRLTKFDLRRIDAWIEECSVEVVEKPRKDTKKGRFSDKLHIALDYLPPKKACSRCKKEKLLDEFYKNIRGGKGRSSYCKVCVRAKQAARDRKRKSEQPRKIQAEKKAIEEEKDEKEKVPWEVGGECEILNNKGEVIFKNGKAFGKEGEEWLRKKRLLEEKGNE